MEEIEATNPVDGGTLSAPEVDQDTGGDADPNFEGPAFEPQRDEFGNPIEEGPEDSFEEIERDGKRARIPSWLKPELMMQADYTRKTQELASARRAFEAERQTVQHASEEERSAEAGLAIIDAQIDQFLQIDWNAWQQSDPEGAEKAFAEYLALDNARAQTIEFLGDVREERAFREQQDSAMRLEQGAAILARDIADWSPQTAAKLVDFGLHHYGFSLEDLSGIDDPRVVKVLHAACQWEEHQKNQRRAQSHADAQTARPAAKVSGATPRSGLDDRLSAEEWLRRRNEQVRRKR
jgi:hypothetical protein